MGMGLQRKAQTLDPKEKVPRARVLRYDGSL